MVNLIRSRFSRVFQSKTFFIILFCFFVLGFAFSFVYNRNVIFDREFYVNRSFSEFLYDQYGIGPITMFPASQSILFDPEFCDSYNKLYISCEEFIRYSYSLFGAVSAVFISILIGKEFVYGTVRNKMIAGYSRKSMYFADLIVCIAAEIIMLIVYVFSIFIPIIIIFFRYLGTNQTLLFSYSLKYDLAVFIIGLSIMIVYASIFLFISYITASQSKAIVGCVFVYVIMYILGMLTDQQLYPFDYVSDITDANPIFQRLDNYENYDDFMEDKRGDNPELSNIEISFYKVVEDVLPTCQANVTNRSENIPRRGSLYIVSNLSVSIVMTAIGAFVFNKKDIK